MTTSAIDVLFLRDIDHGGPARQANTVAKKLAAFVDGATETVEVAIYDFRLTTPALAKTVVGSLIAAAERGVTVRIAYDAGKPAKATAKQFALLEADPAPVGTAQWVATQFGNSDVQIKAVTAPSGQLMHSKYIVRDADAESGTAAVWTGSTNFTDDAWTLQENNIVTVASAALAKAYQDDFDDLWAAGSIKGTGLGGGGTTQVDAAAVRWDFAPGDGEAIDAAMTAAVAAATEKVMIAIMVLTSPTLLAALVAALGRGAELSGIYDSGQMGPIEREWAKYPKDVTVLANWKQVKATLVAKKSAPYKDNSPHNFMHCKILITDNDVFTGSFNFSANAEKNAENQLHITADQALFSQYEDFIAALVATYR